MTLPPFLQTALEQAAAQARSQGAAVIDAAHLLAALTRSPASRKDKALHKASLEALAEVQPVEPAGITKSAAAGSPDGKGADPGELGLDPRLQQLLVAWSRLDPKAGGDARGLQRALLENWHTLLEPDTDPGAEEGEGEADAWLKDLFSPELDLNLRYGNTPMAGLLDHNEYLPAMMEVLIRRYRQNLLLYGPKGSGRHSVLRRLIENTAAGRVPAIFANRRFFEFSAEVFLGGVEEPAELVRRFDLLSTHLDHNPGIVLVTDRLHAWLGSENPLLNDFVQRLLGMMDTRSHHLVVLEDLGFYNAVYRANPALEELLAPVYVAPMRKEEVLQVLAEVRSRVEDHYHIPVPDLVLARIVEQADEHLPALHFPRKALVLLDTALAILALQEPASRDWDKAVDLALIRITGQARRHYPDLEQRLATLEPILLERVIGQDEAIREICRSLRFQKSELDIEAERPDGVYLLAGPAGVGKQVLVDELSRQLYGRKPLVINLQEFNEPESLLRLVGTPDSAGPTLAQSLHNMPRSVLLFRNLEYAAPEVIHWLLQCISSGRVRDARNLESPISELTVVLLSDLVALDEHRGPMGFIDPDHQGPPTEAMLQEYFNPELLQAMDKVILFHPLGEQTLEEILRRKLLPELEQRVQRLGHQLVVCEDVIQHIAAAEVIAGRNAQTLSSGFRRLLAMPVNEALLAHPGTSLTLNARVEGGVIVIDVVREEA